MTPREYRAGFRVQPVIEILVVISSSLFALGVSRTMPILVGRPAGLFGIPLTTIALLSGLYVYRLAAPQFELNRSSKGVVLDAGAWVVLLIVALVRSVDAAIMETEKLSMLDSMLRPLSIYETALVTFFAYRLAGLVVRR